MKSVLEGNYRQAESAAVSAGLDGELQRLSVRLQASVATINLPANAMLNILQGDVYKNYWRTLRDGQRKIASESDHATRDKVDSAVHVGYKDQVIDAALSTSGAGLRNYGDVTAVLSMTSIQNVASVLRDNAYQFYVDFELGGLHAKEPPGWRATWEDRHLLGVAKLANRLTPGCSDTEIDELVLFNGPARDEDAFIEVHIFRRELAATDVASVSAIPGALIDAHTWNTIKYLHGHQTTREASA